MGSFRLIVRLDIFFSLQLVEHQNYNTLTMTNFFEYVLLDVH